VVNMDRIKCQQNTLISTVGYMRLSFSIYKAREMLTYEKK